MQEKLESNELTLMKSKYFLWALLQYLISACLLTSSCFLALKITEVTVDSGDTLNFLLGNVNIIGLCLVLAGLRMFFCSLKNKTQKILDKKTAALIDQDLDVS